jgi:hypothetical protein
MAMGAGELLTTGCVGQQKDARRTAQKLQETTERRDG